MLGAISDFTVRVWDAATGAALLSLRGHTKNVHVLEGHPLQPEVALCASYDGFVSIWDLDKACLLTRCGLAQCLGSGARESSPSPSASVSDC